MTTAFVEMERLRAPHSGLGELCTRTGREMVRLRPADLDLCFYVPPAQRGAFGPDVRYAVHSPLHRLLPASREPFDIWHCFHQESRYLPPRRKTKLVLTIHDINFIRKYSGPRLAARLMAMQKRIDRADAITFTSRYTERDVRERLRIGDRPTRVVYAGASLERFPDAPRPPFAPPGPFLFTIGVIQPRKNFGALVPLLRGRPDLYLVVAGPGAPEHVRAIGRLASEMGVAERVILPGSVSAEQKYWLYASCEAFAFPSLSEGFGLPVLEAMSLGKPVFASTSTSLPEVGGDEAYYWPDLRPEAMLHVLDEGMRAYRSDPDKPERERRWAARFSWEAYARAFLALYDELSPRKASGQA